MKYFTHKFLIVLLLITAGFLGACGNKEKKHEIIAYVDFKCPYCKKFDENIMSKITKSYIDTDKATVTYVNAAILGDESKLGSAATHAVKDMAPEKYLEFKTAIFKHQGPISKMWLTEAFLDKEIDKLKLNDQITRNIKNAYKDKNSQAWKNMKADQKRIEKEKIEEIPAIKIDGKLVKDVHDYNDIKTQLDQ
ncbi:DsbA family protein [Staphylococcus hyicus]|uniref:DsbA family protein n=1 Tax=Staphylococcus hyicus TaxID=1284 RepID=UPI00236634EE|nr:thioredoxin domain-containing protein [Staphylococcus hyicus]